MRGKEEAFDYRYFPDPDLPILELEQAEVDRIRRSLPELPGALEERLVEAYGLSPYDAELLAAYPARAAYFEEASGDRGEAFAKQVANFVMGPMAAELNRRSGGVTERDVLAGDALARIVELRLDGTLSSTTADRAVEILLEEGGDPERVIEEHGLAQVSDEDQLSSWVDRAVEAHPDEAVRFADGEEKLIGFFMGAVMRQAGGKADPDKTRQLLRDRLSRVDPEG